MADKKDYPNRRVLSLEEVEAVAGGAVARPSMSLITIEGTPPPTPRFDDKCSKCKQNFQTEADRELPLRWSFAEHYLLCTDERVGRSFP